MTPRSLARLAWLAPFFLGCVAIWMVSGMERPPLPDALSFRFADKLLHAVAYGGMGALALLGVLGARGFSASGRGAVALLALLLASGYGAVDELHQAVVPGRSSTVGDWVADTVGALLVVAGWWRSRRLPRPRG